MKGVCPYCGNELYMQSPGMSDDYADLLCKVCIDKSFVFMHKTQRLIASWNSAPCLCHRTYKFIQDKFAVAVGLPWTLVEHSESERSF